MERRNVTEQDRAGALSPGKDGLRALLKRRSVQTLLATVAVVQVVAVQQTVDGRSATSRAAIRASADSVGSGMGAESPEMSEVANLWAARAVERKSREIVEEYRAAGYPVTDRVAQVIHSEAVRNGIEPDVAFGLVRAESSFRPNATSPVGAVGLTQLMPNTAKWLSPETSRSQLRDPETNVRIGFAYLRQLIDKYEGDVDLALVAYNRGPGTVDRALRQGRDPDNGYSKFVRGEDDHGHTLFTR